VPTLTNQQKMQLVVTRSDGKSHPLMPFATTDADGKRLDQLTVDDAALKEPHIADLMALGLLLREPEAGAPTVADVTSPKKLK